MKRVSPTMVNRFVAMSFNRIALDIINESDSAGDLRIAHGLFISSSDLAIRVIRDMDTIEKNVEFSARLLARWRSRG